MQDHAEQELTDRAAARDTGDKDADEGRPGNPPGPVENGPGLDPVVVTLIKRRHVEAHADEVLQVIAR